MKTNEELIKLATEELAYDNEQRAKSEIKNIILGIAGEQKCVNEHLATIVKYKEMLGKVTVQEVTQL